MLLRTVKTRSPGILIFLMLITFLLWWSSFINPQIPRFHFDQVGMPLYQWVMNVLDQHTLVNRVVAFIILLLHGLLVLRFNQRYILIPTQTYSHAIFYLLITSSFVQLQRINPGLLSSLFVFLMLDQLFAAYRKPYILNRMFMAGMFVSLAGLFYLPSVVFILLIWIGLFILRSFNLREWFVPLLGLAFPLLFVFAYYYLSEALSLEGLINTLKNNYQTGATITYYNISYYIFFGLTGILVVLGSFSLLGRFPQLKIYVRKYYEIWWWMFSGTIALFVLSSQASVELLYFAVLPLSFLLADYMHALRSAVLGNTMLFLFIVAMAMIQYMN